MILLSSSVVLGLTVLIGVPILVVSLGLVIRPLQARQRAQREEVGRLTALGADTAAGLRVLRGIGGEQAFYDRYRDRSQRVRLAGVRVATPESTLDAAQVLLPGIFVVIVTWVGARFVLSGTIDAGDLVAFYGYAAFLVIPLRTAGGGGRQDHARARGRSPDGRRAERPAARDRPDPMRGRCRRSPASRSATSARA